MLMPHDDAKMTKGPAPSLKSLGLTPDGLVKLVRAEAKKRKKFAVDEVKYAKESLASAVFRLQEAQHKARGMRA